MGVPISNVTRRVVYAASGTGPYAFTFEILASTDIAVYKDDTLLTLTTDYSVTIASNGTGSITLVSSPTGATQIAIVGNRTIQRTTDFVTGGDFFANTVNDEMDQQTIFAQQNAEGLQRALSAPQTDPTTINMTLPRATVRAGKILSFDTNGNPATVEAIGSNRGNWATTTSYYVRDIIKDTTNNNIWQCITAHTSTGSQPIGTNADVAKWTLLVDAATATTSATNAAASASSAATSQATASSAATSASASATTATSAQVAAEAARDATLAAFDNFDDRYLGAKSSDPTVDNDGNALVAGALYFNTVSSAMKVYTGSIWAAAYVSGSGYLASANNLSDLSNAATARTNLGLAIGTNVQAYDADLDAWALRKAPTSDGISGQLLTSSGAGVAPTWTTPASAGAGGTTASGNVTLTSSSSGSQAITTTGWGQTVTLPSATTLSKAAVLYTISNIGPYPLRVANNAGTLLGFIYPYDSNSIGLADNSTAAGVWLTDGLDPVAVSANYYSKTINGLWGLCDVTTIDSTRTFVLFYSSGFLYGTIFDSSTGTFGTATLIFSAANVANNGQGSIPCARTILSATNQLLCVWCGTNGNYYACVLSLSGTTITVNTTTTQAGGNAPNTMSNLVAVGTSYVVATNWNASTQGLNAYTISGTTVTIGTRTVITGSSGNNNAWQMVLYSPNSTKVLAFYVNSVDSYNYAQLATVSGTSITLNGNGGVLYSASGFRVAPMGSYYAMFYLDASGLAAATIFTVSGTSLSQSTATFGSPGGSLTNALTNMDVVVVSATKAFVVYQAFGCNILTNTSGTASAGTALTFNTPSQRGNFAALGFSGNYASFILESDFYNINKYVVDISGTSPTMFDYGLAQFRTQNSTNASRTGSLFGYSNVVCGHDPYTFNGSVAIAANLTSFPITTAAPLAGSAIYKSSSKVTSILLGTGITYFDPSSTNKTVSWLGSNGAVNGTSTGLLIQRIESAA